MRLLVTGAAGLLGSELMAIAAERGHDVAGGDREDLDVTDATAVRAAVDGHRPDAVLHCAAYTAVDRAEEEPELARRINVDGARTVAAAAAAAGAATVYVSTDFVFDGRKGSPYLPEDPTGPLGVYGATKLAGEQAVAAACPEHLVVRTSWLYGTGGPSFVTAILKRAAEGGRLRVVDDQRGRPTWSRNMAGVLLDLTERGARGVWHAADAGETTWHALALEALRLRGLGVDVEPVSTEDWGAAAPRPRYSVLDTRRTEELLGRTMMHWTEALRRFLEAT